MSVLTLCQYWPNSTHWLCLRRLSEEICLDMIGNRDASLNSRNVWLIFWVTLSCLYFLYKKKFNNQNHRIWTANIYLKNGSFSQIRCRVAFWRFLRTFIRCIFYANVLILQKVSNKNVWPSTNIVHSLHSKKSVFFLNTDIGV